MSFSLAGIPLRYWLALFALALTWGSSYALVEIALTQFSPAQITGARLVVGSLAIAAVCALRGADLVEARGKWLPLFAMALFGMLFPFLLISWGQTRIDSAAAGLLMAVMPLSVLIFTQWFLPEDPLTRWHWVGFALAFGGVLVMIAPTVAWPPSGPILGYLAVLAGAFCYGATAVIARAVSPRDPWASTLALQLLSLLSLSPVLLMSDTPWPAEPHPAALAAIAILGLVSTGLMSVLFFYLVRATSAPFVSNINFLIPLWAVFVGVVVLGEPATLSMAVAGLLVMSGIAVAQRSTSTGADPKGGHVGRRP